MPSTEPQKNCLFLVLFENLFITISPRHTPIIAIVDTKFFDFQVTLDEVVDRPSRPSDLRLLLLHHAARESLVLALSLYVFLPFFTLTLIRTDILLLFFCS